MQRKGRLAVALTLLAATIGALPFAEAPSALADNQTVSNDTLRTAWDPKEPGLSAGAVVSGNFGQLFATRVQGQVYSQPLIIGSTLVAATEDNWVYGLDAGTGAIQWSRSLGAPWPASTTGCADLVPNIGNTGTGVYDPDSGYVYLTTKVNDGPDADHPSWYLHAVNVVSGAEKTGWPVKIVGTPSNDPDHPFAARDVNERPGLLLMNGVVYMAFGSHCDHGTYVGWVAGVNTANGVVNLWSDETGVTSTEAGIWQAGGGLVSDGPGRIFLSTGNGTTPPNSPGSTPPKQLSQSVVRLGVDANGVLSAKDFFSPYNAALLDQNDQDFGSGGPAALPDQYFGTASIPHLLVSGGKDGRVFLLNRDHLGGKAQGPGGGDDVVQVLGPYHGFWSRPAVYGGEGGYVYMIQSQSQLLALKYGVTGDGKPTLALAGNGAENYGYTSGSPIVTSDGTTPGSAVVWILGSDGPTGSNGRLCAYRGVPVNNQLVLLRCFNVGTVTKFATPAAANGRVYAGTRDGYVYGFGQPTTSPLTVTQVDVGNVNVGESGNGTVTATATRPITVTAVATSAPFGATPPSLPVTLNAGENITVPVTFTPTAPGSTTALLKFTVNDNGTSTDVATTLVGNGIKAGFTANTPTLDFGQLPVGSTKMLTASFTNTGTADETVTAVTAPTGVFTATGLPAGGTVVAPGQTVAVGVTYQPTTVGSSSSSLSVTGPSGTATVALTGSGVTGQAKLTISPSSLSFGSVPVGTSVTKTLTVSNTGNLGLTITKAAPPALPFVVNTPLPESQALGPDDQIEIQVTFTPTAAGSFTGTYIISSDDGTGAHNIAVTGTATNPTSGTPVPNIVGGSWIFNGSAGMNGQSLQLTPNQNGATGTAIYSAPISSDNLTATFTTQIGGGGGADGMTFALLDATANSVKSVGGGGGGLGFQNLPGVAVTFDTWQGGNDPSNNFIGLTTGPNANGLAYVATATNVPNLRTGTHSVTVKTASGRVTVSIDGTQVISAAVTLPTSTLVAFTGATGGVSDTHAVSNVSIMSGSTPLPAPGTGWRFNGSAYPNGPEAVLTPAQNSLAGTAIYSTPVNTNGLSASFNLAIAGGTGADGAAFLLLDPGAAPTSLGNPGAGLGYSGLPAVGVTFNTWPENGVNSHNWVSISTSTAGATGLTVTASNTTTVPDLRTGVHKVQIDIVGLTINVAIDGTQVLSGRAPALKSTALVGFAGSTGGLNDVHSVRDVQITGGPALNQVAAPPAAGWTANGNAVINGGTLRLTGPVAMQRGTAIWGTPIAPARLNASFTIRIGDGNGADGTSFMLLDAASCTPTSLGGAGGGLGFSGLTGVSVDFITYNPGGYPASNLIAISTSAPGQGLNLVATATNIPNLRTGTHAVQVRAGGGGDLVVTIDGATVLDTLIQLPVSTLVGFSGGTGGLYDTHEASNINIQY